MDFFFSFLLRLPSYLEKTCLGFGLCGEQSWMLHQAEHSLVKSVSLRFRWLFKHIKLLQSTVSFIQSFWFPKVEELKAVKYCCFPEMSLWYCQTTPYRLVFPCSFVVSINQSVCFWLVSFFLFVWLGRVFCLWRNADWGGLCQYLLPP